MPGTATLDTAVPNAARAYDHLLGGRAAFAADRELVARIEALHADPSLPRTLARKNRVYQELAVTEAVEAGCRQILVAGAGFPQARDLHHVAAEENPAIRCAYLDIDPVAVTYGRALTAETCGVTFAHGDLTRPGDVAANPDIASVLDFSEPACLILGLVLHFMAAADARRVIAGWGRLLPAGSRIVVTVAHWLDLRLFGQVREVYEPAEVFNHAPLQAQQWFRGMDLLEPGICIARGLAPEALAPPAPACVLGGTGIVP